MEVDDRLRWLEGRVSSSLHPKGEELRKLLSNNENRSAFLDFCNNSEVRHLFIHLPSDGLGCIKLSRLPPSELSNKALFFLKCSNASRLSKENISEDVVYSECSQLPMEHLELVVREVYLPMLSSQHHLVGISSERILDVLHRLMGSVQVTQGHQNDELVLPLPSFDVLSDWANSASRERRVVMIHVMETCVVSWMKQVKMAMHFDPAVSILKSDGKMAGPLTEVKYWEHRLHQLISVRDQLSSIEVIQILHGLEQVHSTYADAFIDVHRDVRKAIIDTELVLMYVNTLKPWFQKLHAAFSPETLIKLFPSIVVTLSLVWQHSGFYAISSHFHRLLRLISNELALKARDIVGEDVLSDPGKACVNIRLALRMCSAFRGYYLDRKELVEGMLMKYKEQQYQQQQEGILHHSDSSGPFGSTQGLASTHSTHVGANLRETHATVTGQAPPPQLCSWPARNVPAFHTLNMTMERCNDLLELVQTIEHFSELSPVASLCSSDGLDPVLTDIYDKFNTALYNFKSTTKDLLCLEANGFETSFFEFRKSVKELESQLSSVLLVYFKECSSFEAILRLIESFQGLISRDSVQALLKPELETVVDTLHSDIVLVRELLSSLVSHPPILPNTPPTSTRLLWLQAVRQRVDIPMERIRFSAAYLLQGEKGFTLRHTYAEVIREIDEQWSAIINNWMKSVPENVESKLQQNILRQDDCGTLHVNFNLLLEQVLRETHYLTGPVLSSLVTLPNTLSTLCSSISSQTLHQYRTSLEVCIRQYNELHHSLDSIHRSLFLHKLQILDNLIQDGINNLTWLSPEVPDFLAKFKGTLTTDILPSVDEVLCQTQYVDDICRSWSAVPTLDMFIECETNSLEQLIKTHRALIEKLECHLSTSMKDILRSTEKAFKVVEVSWESPSWMDYLHHLDGLVTCRLKKMILKSLNTLSLRAQKYEQGGSIPPMVGVSVVLHGKQVQFNPPLSSTSALSSVPEVIKRMLEGFLSLTKTLHRLIPAKQDYFIKISNDNEVLSVVQKITAHIETSARQCQSLCKKFSQYAFLWEQDVISTFNSFLNGVAEPHPRHFTRPETVCRSRSASHSARPRSSHSAKIHSTSQTNSSVMESVTGVTDWEFLKPDTVSYPLHASSDQHMRGVQERVKPKNPTLDDFDGELAVFQGILERLKRSPDNVDIGWIYVDQISIKDALISLTNKWMHVYATYLEKKVLSVLCELEVFFSDIEPEVEVISGEEVDPSHIMKLVTILNKVNLQQLVMDGKFGAVHRAVAILNKFHQPLSITTKNQFEATPHRWSTLKKRLALSKQRLSPHIQSHSTTITHDLQIFDEEAKSLHNEFLSSDCLLSHCDSTNAHTLISEYYKKLLSLQAQAKDLMELQELLQSAVVNFSLLKQFQEELNTACQLWENREIIIIQHADWKSQLWLSVDTEEMITSCDNHMTSLTSLDACSQSWDIRVTLEEAICEIQLTIPLVEGLCSPFMRPRHWKQVLRYSPNLSLLAVLLRNGAVDLTMLTQLTIGKLMELKLTAHSEDVLLVIQRAGKDLAVEELLKNLEEVWLSMQFQLKPHIRLRTSDQAVSDISAMKGTTPHSPSSSVKRKSASSGRISVISATPITSDRQDILLLEHIDKIFDSLDYYQTSLQSLERSLAASSFQDDLQRWHIQLQTVEAVLCVWGTVQAMWVQLEGVLSSSEVSQYLPTQYFMFSTMDKEWRVLMRDTAKAPNVLNICLQEDLLSTLEKFQSSLIQCQSALLQYMEGRRAKCPWFYFLPLEDILKLVCYGSRLSILAENIPKLLLNSAGLEFNDSLPLSSPSPSYRHTPSYTMSYITGILSSEEDTFSLMESVRCDGPVEAILNHLIQSVGETLQKQLNTCLTNYILPSTPLNLALKRLPSLWNSSMSPQVIQIATQVLIYTCIQDTLSNKGEKLLEQILNDLKQLQSLACMMNQGHVPQDLFNVSLPALTEVPHAVGSESTVMDSTVALKASESHLVTVGSGLSTEPLVESQHVVFEDETTCSSTHETNDKAVNQKASLHNIIILIQSYIEKVKELISIDPTGEEIQSSFNWQSMVHYTYNTTEQVCTLEGIGVSLSYGFFYTGVVPVMTAPGVDRLMVHMLQAMQSHSSGLVLAENPGDVCSIINDVSLACGYPLYPVICSPNTTYSVLMNSIKGMATTGSWLYLHNINLLSSSLLQAVIEMLQEVKIAKMKKSQILKIQGDTLRFTRLDTAFCLASTNHVSLSNMPSSILSAFQTYSLAKHADTVQIEGLLMASGFKCAGNLKTSLAKLCNELGMKWLQLKSVIQRAAQHIAYQCTEDNTTSSTATNNSSLIFSSIAQQVINTEMGSTCHTSHVSSQQVDRRTSRAATMQTKLQNISEEEEDLVTSPLHNEEADITSLQLEELCILMALWELYMPQASEDNSSLMSSLQEVFPGCSISSLFDEAEKACEELTQKYSWNRETVESLQESRAISVMYSNSDVDNRDKDPRCIEDAIIHASLLEGISLSPHFLHTVHSLVLLLLGHRVVSMTGSIINGRREALKMAVEVLKSIGYNVNVSNLPINAIGENELLGDHSGRDGILPQYLSKLSPSPNSSSSSSLCPLSLVLLEGTPTSLLIDTLQWISNTGNILRCPNMKTVMVDSSVKFVLVVPESSDYLSLTSSIPSIVLHNECTSWRTILRKKLLSLDKVIHEYLMGLCEAHIPNLLAFLSPLFQNGPQIDGVGVSPSLSQEAVISCQQIVFNELQLIKSLCEILQCLFVDSDGSLSEDAMECCFTYALIWSYGGALNEKNKEIFETWVRNVFNNTQCMDKGSLWEYKLSTGPDFRFQYCQNRFRSHNDSLYVYTSRTAALAEVAKLLLKNEVSVLFDGHCGSGKTSFLLNTLNDDATSLLHMYIDQHSTTRSVWNQLSENLTWHSGNTYVPSGMETLITLVDDLHLLKHTNTANGSVSGLLQHHLSHHMIYAPCTYKEYNVGGIVYACTTDTNQASLSDDLMNDLFYLHWDQYSPKEMMFIYSMILTSHFIPATVTETELSEKFLTMLVESAVHIHNRMCSIFLHTDDRKHYVFTQTTLDFILRSLCFKLDSTASLHHLLTYWLHETYWSYAARMTSIVDKERYMECVYNAIKKYFSDHSSLPYLLSQVPIAQSLNTDKKAILDLLTHTQQHLNLTNPTSLPPLYDTDLLIASRIIHHLHAPHFLSSFIVIGMGGMEQLSRLIASAHGYTFTRPSQVACNGLLSVDSSDICSAYCVSEFKTALKSIYCNAGIKNEHILLYLDDIEVPDSAYLPSVYQFIKDCSISVDFTSEEKSKITNTLRSEVCRDGRDYSQTMAWSFFKDRVRKNVRIVLSLSDLPTAFSRGIIDFKDLLAPTHITYQLPWKQRFLLNVALQHLTDQCNLPKGLLENTAHLLCSLHVSLCDLTLQSNGVLLTPTNDDYQYFVRRFCYELKTWEKHLLENTTQVEMGLHCIGKARKKVSLLQEKLKRETVVMEEKEKSYTQLLIQVGQDTAIAEEQNELVKKQTERIQHLQQVLPEYEHIYGLYTVELECIEHSTKDIALNLDQQSLLDLRSQTKPSLAVQELLEAVIIIVKSPSADLSWTKGAKRIMANVDRFREMLMEFSQQQEISDVLIGALQSYTNKNGFTEDNMTDISGCVAAGQLCAWVKGVERYHQMLQDNIHRLDNRRIHVKASLQEYTDKLMQLQHKVQVLNERLDGLSGSIEQASIEKSQQGQIVYQMNKELKETNQLIKALYPASEQWSIQRQQLNSALNQHIGPLALAVAFCSYLTSYSSEMIYSIITSHLQPCVTDKGFVLDSNVLLRGLLDELCPQPPGLASVVQSFGCEILSVDKESAFCSGDSFPTHPDSSLNQVSFEDEVPRNVEPTATTPYSVQYQTDTSIKESDSFPYHESMNPYENLCYNMLSILNPNSFSMEVLSRRATITSSLYKHLLKNIWNKWPFIYDPEGVVEYLLQQIDQEWIIIDATEWSYKLLHSLERSLVEGHHVVLTNVCLPFHPSILPVIQAGLYWHNADQRPLSTEFCGRRLHINKSFRLIITTTTLPKNTFENHALQCHTHLINAAPSTPLCRELLLQIAQDTSHLFDVHMYNGILEEIDSCYEKVSQLNKQLMDFLGKIDQGEPVMMSVSRVEQLMTNMNEVVENQKSFYKSLADFTSLQDHFSPVCLFTASVFQTLQYLSAHIPQFNISLTQYKLLFQDVLKEDQIVTLTESWEGKEDEAIRESDFESIFKQQLMTVILSKCQRILPHYHLLNLTIALVLLSRLTITSCIFPSNEIQQILYIAGGDSYLGTLNASTDSETGRIEAQLPPRPDYVPHELFTSLYSLPINSSILENLRTSMFGKQSEWEELLETSNMALPTSLPWKNDRVTTKEEISIMIHDGFTLDDLVILKAISSTMVSNYFYRLSGDIIKSLPLLTLSNVLRREEAPLLVMYDEQDIVSQANMIVFEDTLSHVLNSGEEAKSLFSLSFGSLRSEEILKQLSQTTADCVLIKNVHLGDNEWCLKLTKRLRQFHNSGQRSILLVDYNNELPKLLLSLCDLVNLSQIIPNDIVKHRDIVQQLHATRGPHKYLYTLLMVLSAIPESIQNELETYDSSIKPLIFLLSALHSHILIDKSIKPPQLHTLVNCLCHLAAQTSTSAIEIKLYDLIDFVKHAYDLNDDYINLYLKPNVLEEGAIVVPQEGLPLPVPTSSVSPHCYGDHVIGVINSLQETHEGKMKLDVCEDSNTEEWLVSLLVSTTHSINPSIQSDWMTTTK